MIIGSCWSRIDKISWVKILNNLNLKIRFFLFSFTTRVTDLIEVLSDVNQGNCIRTGINNTTIEKKNDGGQIRTQDGIIK
jgi:hypothetical protein